MATDLLFRDDAYLQTASARVTVVHAQGVELDDDDGRLRLLEQPKTVRTTHCSLPGRVYRGLAQRLMV